MAAKDSAAWAALGELERTLEQVAVDRPRGPGATPGDEAEHPDAALRVGVLLRQSDGLAEEGGTFCRGVEFESEHRENLAAQTTIDFRLRGRLTEKGEAVWNGARDQRELKQRRRAVTRRLRTGDRRRSKHAGLGARPRLLVEPRGYQPAVEESPAVGIRRQCQRLLSQLGGGRRSRARPSGDCCAVELRSDRCIGWVGGERKMEDALFPALGGVGKPAMHASARLRRR